MGVAFIGLGIMGSRMAAQLIQNNVSLSVLNRSAAPMQLLEEQGARKASSFKDAVGDAEVVFSMLPSPEVIEEVITGKDGSRLAAMKQGAIWVDCSTVNPSFSISLHRLAEKYKLRFLDIPVAGTKTHAEQADLTFLAGGMAEDLEKVEPLLKYMGKTIVHVGPAGAGSSLKMLVNNMLAQAMAAFAETLALGEKLGLEKKFLLSVLPGLPVAAPFLKAKADIIQSEDFSAHFPLKWMHKDLHLLSQTAYEYKQPMPLASLTREIYAQAERYGLGRDDFAAIYKWICATRTDQETSDG